MDLVELYALKGNVFAVANAHFDKNRNGCLNEAEMSEMLKVNALQSLTLEEHYRLPVKTREIVEELWTARVFDVNVKRQQERQTRLLAELKQ